MARPLRIEYPGALYHVTSRGDRQEAIFDDDQDRRAFLKVLGDVVSRYRWRRHAYFLMGNHYHLMIETPEANLTKGMRQLNGVFTQCSNRRHKRSGHLFQGRYKAILVDRDSYFLELARYVVLNPVRAAMVKYPHLWVWSSYGAMIGKATPPAWSPPTICWQSSARGGLGRDGSIKNLSLKEWAPSPSGKISKGRFI